MRSEWQWPSTNPGDITRSCTSTVCTLLWRNLPMSAMTPFFTPTSPKNQGFPVPSTTRPFFKMRSSTALLPTEPSRNLPASRHRHLFYGSVLIGQIYRIVQVHGAADVVGYDPDGGPDPEVALSAQRDHAVLLHKPLQNRLRVADNLPEPDQV